jgi:polysaccharide export outer membrane protein
MRLTMQRSLRPIQRVCQPVAAGLIVALVAGCASHMAGPPRASGTSCVTDGGQCVPPAPGCAVPSGRYSGCVPDYGRPGALHGHRNNSVSVPEKVIRQVSLNSDVPRELRKVSLPEYVIEPPDILLIDAVSHLRPANAQIRAGEPLLIQVNRTIPLRQQEDPVAVQFKQINGVFLIGADGYLDLGPEYGKVLVADQPLSVIQQRIEQHLQHTLTAPQVLVTLPNPEAKQYVAGQHLVRPDGTVGLGIYGSVYVTGMTLQQARLAIEQHLAKYINRPEVVVDVLAYNSKVYYVVTDGGGAGEQVWKLPSTGNETVLDAIANINGLPTVASKSDIWIARPSADVAGPDRVLPVDWNGIVQGAQTGTNYQVLPGDRIYVKADKLIRFDTAVAKITAPFERLLGFTILGNATVRTLQVGEQAFNNNN